MCASGGKMPRALVPCLTIVAAFHLHVAAAGPLYEDVPVPPAAASAARSIGLDPATGRAHFLSELVRVLHAPPAGRNRSTEALVRALADGGAGSESAADAFVPVPLTASLWSEQVFRRPIDAAQLFGAIVSDRQAALLAYGLAGLDEPTLAFLVEQPGLLHALYQESAAAFAAFSESLRIRDGRASVPGGDQGAPLWTAVVGAPPDQAGSFVRALFGQHRGRLAYLFDLVASLDPERAAFALGLWIPDASVRAARFAALAASAVEAYGEWHVGDQPFARPLNDLTILLMRVRVGTRGAPIAPASRTFWAAVFATDDPNAPAPAALDGAGDAIDAAWLVEMTSGPSPYARGDRLDQFAFGQRVFGDASSGELQDVLAAVRGFRSHRMLAATLERMGIDDPSLFATVIRHVSRLPARDAGRAFWSLAQLQGALAIVARATAVGTIDGDEAASLVASLTAVPVQSDGRYAGAVAAWMDRELLPLLPPSARPEGRILAASAGPSDPRAPVVQWEGEAYRLDFAAAELDRLRAVREKQGGYTVDLALALLGVVRMLRNADANTLQDAASALEIARLEFGRELGRPPPDILARDVRPPADARQVMATVGADLASAARRGDGAAVPRAVGPLTDLVDTVLGEALLSLAYAMNLGDAEGTALLGRNVAMRHDFGLSHPDSGARARLPWSLPRQEFRPGVAWHVVGSALGLDIGLAPLALRRLSVDLPPDAPSLTSIEREAFAVSVALLDPRRLRDRDRDAIAGAMARGRARVRALTDGPALERLGDEVGMSARRRRALRHVLAQAPQSAVSELALSELLVLGGGARGADLDAWGMSGLATVSCPCTRFVPARRWSLLEGRPQMGFVAGGFSDLNLHMAEMLHDLHVPAPLAKSVLAAAVLEFTEHVTPVHLNDWRTLSRAVQAVSRERVEDYVAAAAAVGGPLVPVGREGDREP